MEQTMEKLARDVLMVIFLNFSKKTLITARRVCKSWKTLSNAILNNEKYRKALAIQDGLRLVENILPYERARTRLLLGETPKIHTVHIGSSAISYSLHSRIFLFTTESKSCEIFYLKEDRETKRFYVGQYANHKYCSDGTLYLLTYSHNLYQMDLKVSRFHYEESDDPQSPWAAYWYHFYIHDVKYSKGYKIEISKDQIIVYNDDENQNIEFYLIDRSWKKNVSPAMKYFGFNGKGPVYFRYPYIYSFDLKNGIVQSHKIQDFTINLESTFKVPSTRDVCTSAFEDVSIFLHKDNIYLVDITCDRNPFHQVIFYCVKTGKKFKKQLINIKSNLKFDRKTCDVFYASRIFPRVVGRGTFYFETDTFESDAPLMLKDMDGFEFHQSTKWSDRIILRREKEKDFDYDYFVSDTLSTSKPTPIGKCDSAGLYLYGLIKFYKNEISILDYRKSDNKDNGNDKNENEKKL